MSTFRSCCDNAIFTLFGSIQKHKFSEKISLFDNFISMCSLSSLKSDSDATLELKEIIKKNDFTYNENDKGLLSYESREKRIMDQCRKLDNIRHAIMEWEIVREKISSRSSLIKSFKNAISDFQSRLVNDIDLSINLKM